MKEFWRVSTKYYDNGKVKAVMCKVLAEEKPENKIVENEMYDEYHDYFDSYDEAYQWYKDAKNA